MSNSKQRSSKQDQIAVFDEYLKYCNRVTMISIQKKLKMYKLSSSVIFISYLCLSQALVIENACPQNVEPVDNFNLEAVSGIYTNILEFVCTSD